MILQQYCPFKHQLDTKSAKTDPWDTGMPGLDHLKLHAIPRTSSTFYRSHGSKISRSRQGLTNLCGCLGMSEVPGSALHAFLLFGDPHDQLSPARAEGLCFGLVWGIDQLGEGLLKLSISAHDVWYAVIQIV